MPLALLFEDELHECIDPDAPTHLSKEDNRLQVTPVLRSFNMLICYSNTRETGITSWVCANYFPDQEGSLSRALSLWTKYEIITCEYATKGKLRPLNV